MMCISLSVHLSIWIVLYYWIGNMVISLCWAVWFYHVLVELETERDTLCVYNQKKADGRMNNIYHHWFICPSGQFYITMRSWQCLPDYIPYTQTLIPCHFEDLKTVLERLGWTIYVLNINIKLKTKKQLNIDWQPLRSMKSHNEGRRLI